MQRCKAKSKRSGKQCKNYRIKGYNVCRMHGARGGPKTREGIMKCKMAPRTHGFYSKESRIELQKFRALCKEVSLS